MSKFKFSQVITSAPGKVILHGEHSVVHGKKAIACSIGSRVTVTADFISEDYDVLLISIPEIHSENIKIPVRSLDKTPQSSELSDELITYIEGFVSETCSGNLSNFLHLSLSCILYAYCRVFQVAQSSKKSPVFSLEIKSDLPIGAGLGSSAAFNTSIACFFLIISGKISTPASSCEFTAINSEKDLKQVSSLAFEMEKIVHKTPSGIDNSIATFGGAVSFQKGHIEKIEKMPQLKLLIVDTKIPRNTKVLVSGVRELLDRSPEVVNPILESMHNVTISAQKLLSEIYDNPSDRQLTFDLGKLISTNQDLLASIGVSHPSLDKLCGIARKCGFPAKLTGAGGGGCAIVLLNGYDPTGDKIEELKKNLESEGFLCREAVLGGPGVMVKYSVKS